MPETSSPSDFIVPDPKVLDAFEEAKAKHGDVEFDCHVFADLVNPENSRIVMTPKEQPNDSR